IVERVMITGKAPVTNLYASAVFISWGSVLCGFIIDAIVRYASPKASKLGIGALLGSIMGFIVILVSFNLALRSDTFGKVEAVLDTQFWLATHVVCVTFGYVAAFVAGALGLVFLVGSAFSPIFDKDVRRGVSSIIYGIVCFALLLSFFGTVLGGLWADDSWGRFWGWDPKENGALLIVIWNALILHARWGGMIRERGLATLAVGGNIVTCWSWFGVNELGVGLHSYGFTEGVLSTLCYVAIFHLAVIILSMSVSTRHWIGYQERSNKEEKPNATDAGAKQTARGKRK
ncbi:MAG: cytochrome c biogenesis protein CcsA, partial [Planctomycetota bacterium]|nr:cytochrome c biogenesis protein CcsA [Planctomycetota bacterium]